MDLLLSCTTVLCPDKKLTWFDEEEALTAEQLVRQRWPETYEFFSYAETMLQPDSSPAKVCRIYRNCSHGSESNPGAFEVALEWTVPGPTVTGICL